MIITLLTGSLGGALIHYTMLTSIQDGSFSKGLRLWLQCVVAPALMFAMCAGTVVQYFFNEFSYLLALTLWPIFILALQPAYHLTERKEENTQQSAKNEQGPAK